MGVAAQLGGPCQKGHNRTESLECQGSSAVGFIGRHDTGDIRSIVVKNSRFSDSDFAYVPWLAVPSGNVWLVDLRGACVTDACFGDLLGCKGLQTLVLLDTRVSGVGADKLPTDVSFLQELELGGSPVTDSGLEHISRLNSLRKLRLDSTRISDFGLHHLERMENLAILDLSFTGVSDKGLVHIRNMKRLGSPVLHGTRVSRSAIDRLHLDRPDICISTQDIELCDRISEPN